MAKVQKTIVDVEVKQTVKEERYIMSLTRAEVDTLQHILSKVGGSPTESRREHAQAIYDSLTKVGIKYPEIGSEKDDAKGNIIYRDR